MITMITISGFGLRLRLGLKDSGFGLVLRLEDSGLSRPECYW